MQTVIAQFKYTINDREYIFQCAPNAPIADAKEALLQVLKAVGVIEDANLKAIAEMKAKEDAEKVQEITEVQQEPTTEA